MVRLVWEQLAAVRVPLASWVPNYSRETYL